MTIDEAIEQLKEAKCGNCPTLFCEECVKGDKSKQIADWLEKLKTIENIMLKYNADWYADEDNGVPDCEVLESIWNVIQDNGLDIDIEQDYRKGKTDGYNKAIDEFADEFKAYCSKFSTKIITDKDIDWVRRSLKRIWRN